jgi:hypothetical protein
LKKTKRNNTFDSFGGSLSSPRNLSNDMFKSSSESRDIPGENTLYAKSESIQ